MVCNSWAAADFGLTGNRHSSCKCRLFIQNLRLSLEKSGGICYNIVDSISCCFFVRILRYFHGKHWFFCRGQPQAVPPGYPWKKRLFLGIVPIMIAFGQDGLTAKKLCCLRFTPVLHGTGVLCCAVVSQVRLRTSSPDWQTAANGSAAFLPDTTGSAWYRPEGMPVRCHRRYQNQRRCCAVCTA